MLGFKFCQLMREGGFKEMKFFSLIPGLNLDLIHKSRKKGRQARLCCLPTTKNY